MVKISWEQRYSPARSRPVAIPSRVGEPRLCRIDATV